MTDSLPVKWMKARKKSVIVAFREPIPDCRGVEIIETLEGTEVARKGVDYVIRGIKGEKYPIKIDIFNATYDVLSKVEGSDKK